jgi:hypothetical protein
LIAHHITHASDFSREESLKSVLPLLLLLLGQTVPQLDEAMRKQEGRFCFRFSVGSLGIFNWPIPSARIQ